jgi:prepilin peptidase CpaA
MYVMVLVGGITDIRWGKVPNLLTAPCAVIGIALNTLDSGLAGTGASLAGIAIGVAVWFVMPVLGKPLGGGDVKLFAAVGALQGPTFLLYVMLASALYAGVLALCVAASQRRLIATCRQLGQWIHGRVVLSMSEPLATAAPGAKVPFAAAIALGAITVSAVSM